MAVYGNLLSAFPELFRNIKAWTKPDKSDERVIRGVYMPKKGSSLQRQKMTSRGKVIQGFDDDILYTYSSADIKEGDWIESPHDGNIMRVMGTADWGFEGGYKSFRIEKVTGATVDQQEQLQVKEAQFA